MRIKLSILAAFLTLTALIVSFPDSALASNVQKATVHCAASCKVYVDEALVLSLPQGGVKGIYLESGKRQTILITRPGKPDWVHSITPKGAILLNPDEDEPKVLAAGGADNDSPIKGGDAQRATGRLSVAPEWLSGRWLYKILHKPTSLETGPYTCPLLANLTISLEEQDDHQFLLNFRQHLFPSTDSPEWDKLSADGLIACVDLYKSQEWKFAYHIKIESKSAGEVAFQADECLNGGKACQIPPDRGQVTGTIARIDQGTLKLKLEGPLPGEFTLQTVK